MRNPFFIFFITTISHLINAQYKGIGGELLSKYSYRYGKYEVKLSPPTDSSYSSSFFLHAKIKNNIQTIKIDINFKQSFCYISSPKLNISKPFKASKDVICSIEWTPNSIKCIANGMLLIDTTFTTGPLSMPSQVGLSIWRENIKNNLISQLDTTLAEATDFKYYEYVGDNTSSFKLKYTDNFNEFNSTYWIKSTESYHENILRNDTSMLFFDSQKLQLISLSYKTKVGIFKRAFNEGAPKRIQTINYKLFDNSPYLFLAFSDSIYARDKGIKNFTIENNKIIKSKLKSDYKTVILTLEKPIDHKAYLKYYPINSRFNKPQIIEIVVGE